MPIQRSLIPNDPKDLRSKIENTPIGQEYQICGYVQEYLKKHGESYFKQAGGTPRVINLTGDCIVFLIAGSFMVGGSITDQNETVAIKGKNMTRIKISGGDEKASIGLGYLIVGETTLQMREETTIVIIFNPK